MIKNRKLALSMFVALIAGLFVVSATGFTNICLRDGETAYFSQCNPDMEDYVCAETSCQLCVNEISSNTYCPASPQSCNNACIYIYDADQNSTIALVSPESDDKMAPGDIKFTFQVSLPNTLDRCDLYINDVRKRYTTSPKTTNEFTVRSMDAGTYEWRVECKETVSYGGDTLSSSSRMLYLEEGAGDENATPNILLTSPADAAVFTGAQALSFNFNVASAILSKINECSLYLDSSAVSSISEVIAANQISYNVGVGSHTWKVSCNNGSYTSETRGLTINPVPAPSSGGGGGGGGGGPRIYSVSKTQIESEAGYTQSLKKGEKISFTMVVAVNNTNTTKNEPHTITAKEINNGSAKISIQSTPIDAVLLIDEEKKFDINEDGTYDLSVKLNSADKTRANITAKVISEAIETEEETETTTEETEEETTTEENETETTDGITGASVGIMDKIKSNATIIIIVAIIVIIVIVAVASSSKKGKEKTKEEKKKE